jgi:hypothetical protein
VRQGHQPPDQVRAAARHPHVGDHERRPVLTGRRHRVVAVGSPTDDAEIRLLVEQAGERGADAVVVVRDDDGDHATARNPHMSTFSQVRPVCRDARAPVV